MIKETTVTEQDIFNYVFYTDLLSKEEIESIGSNEKNHELIEFYKKQKEEFNISIKVDIKKKLASRIPAYNISKDK